MGNGPKNFSALFTSSDESLITFNSNALLELTYAWFMAAHVSALAHASTALRPRSYRKRALIVITDRFTFVIWSCIKRVCKDCYIFYKFVKFIVARAFLLHCNFRFPTIHEQPLLRIYWVVNRFEYPFHDTLSWNIAFGCTIICTPCIDREGPNLKGLLPSSGRSLGAHAIVKQSKLPTRFA